MFKVQHEVAVLVNTMSSAIKLIPARQTADNFHSI